MHTHIHVHTRARVSLPPSARPWNMLGRMHVHVHPTIEESELLTPRVTRCIFIPGNDRPSPRARARETVTRADGSVPDEQKGASPRKRRKLVDQVRSGRWSVDRFN